MCIVCMSSCVDDDDVGIGVLLTAMMSHVRMIAVFMNTPLSHTCFAIPHTLSGLANLFLCYIEHRHHHHDCVGNPVIGIPLRASQSRTGIIRTSSTTQIGIYRTIAELYGDTTLAE